MMASLSVRVRLGSVTFRRNRRTASVAVEGSITNRTYQAAANLVAVFCDLYPWLRPFEGQTLIAFATNVGDMHYWKERAASHFIRAVQSSREPDNPRRNGSLVWQTIRGAVVTWNNQIVESTPCPVRLSAASPEISGAPALEMQVIDDQLTVTFCIPDDVDWEDGPPQRNVAEKIFSELQIDTPLAETPPYGEHNGKVALQGTDRLLAVSVLVS